jgi:hypothetical protein
MENDRRDTRLARLEPFAGEWRIEAPGFPLAPALADEARMSIAWTLGGAFLLQRSSIPVPGAPEGLSVIAPDHDGEGYTQHYFDSRGVVRIYAMTFDGRDWTLERRRPDFTPLSFHQRWIGAFSRDADVIEGRWETSPDGAAWALDFELRYVRVT